MLGNLLAQPLVVLVLSTSLSSYWIFKRYEPDSFPSLFALLVGAPALISVGLNRHPDFQAYSYAHVAASFTITHYTLILCFIIVYRLSPLHPLANYPGPVVNKLSKLTMAWVTSRGKQHLYYRSLHDRYGDVVRIGPNELSIRHPDAILPILGQRGLPKGPFWGHREGLEKDSYPPLIAARNAKEHAHRRMPWNRAFSSASLHNYDDAILQNTQQLIAALTARSSDKLDLGKWMGYFALDFMGDMVFGKTYDIMASGADVKGIHDILAYGIKFIAITGQIPWAISSLRFFSLQGQSYKRLKEYARESALQRINDFMRAKDLFYHLNDEEGIEPVKRPISLVVSDASFAMIAGSDTTATTLTAFWYYLLSNSWAYKRLQNEINTVFPNDELPTELAKMTTMPYLNACINETLRLLPATLSGAQRSVLPHTGGKAIGPFFVPEGTQVFVHTYSLHRDSQHFSPGADRFWPDRWLPESERAYPPGISKDDTFILNRSAFIPFSCGPAVCAGRTLALTVMRMVICAMFHTFEISPGGTMGDWEESVEDYFTAKCGPLEAMIKQRRILSE